MYDCIHIYTHLKKYILIYPCNLFVASTPKNYIQQKIKDETMFRYIWTSIYTFQQMCLSTYFGNSNYSKRKVYLFVGD